MNKFILLFTTLAFWTTLGHSQEVRSARTNSNFFEFNYGLALLHETNFLFPGASLLLCETITYPNNTIIEYEAGLAFPSIITGKIGIGKKLNKIKLIAGIRPFPSNLYLQTSFNQRKKGYWLMSIEYNPMDKNSTISLYSKALFTIGYRWDMHKRRN